MQLQLQRDMQPERKRSNSIVLNGITRQRLWELLGTACVFLFAPLIVIALIFLYIYRRLVEIALRIKLRSKFAGLLEGADCVWAVEEAVSPSVINILIILENAAQESNAMFLESFRNLINERIILKAPGTMLEKLLYLRSQKFGYCFWERSETVDLKDRIRWLECVNANCDGSCEDICSESFRKTLENVCNKPLPDDDRATWEILVGRRCRRSRSHKKDYLYPADCFNTDTRKIPVIFRIHHSLGDGEALVGLLLKMIEKDETKEESVKIKSIDSSGEIEKHFKEMVSTFFNNEMIESLKQQAKMSMDRTWYGRIKKITLLTMALLSFPKYFIQLAVRSMEENALHGPPLTGKKIMFYWLDNVTNDKSLNLLMKIRKIKTHTGVKFNDIVLAAFSASVHKYHLRIKKTAPDALTAILPTRMAMPGTNLTLNNDFSFAFLQICIANANGQTIVDPNRDSQFFKRLKDITRANNEFRKRSDLLVNYWIMKYLSALLPVKMLLKTFFLWDGTVGFSNMRGPEKVRILNNSVRNCVFWVPTKNSIALGLSLLSYGGNLQLSLIADKSIVKDEALFTELLENTVYEIEAAYNDVMMRLLKSSDLPIETTAEKNNISACFEKRKYE
ncbi:PREDICTED: uncharacterized protein LOC105450698 isoform X2 [Wasmannia auropunctata]|uniref:uncharacterized protein LOC105450698 isoform X2 n=1 Tax=Wasmannia auropunctata TaxID=64793 RepID=UPI0005F035BA|nr:PREDICTED: uncharacterized protein LOC105450698 isoform X2 [Wasmannia auropunctata]